MLKRLLLPVVPCMLVAAAGCADLQLRTSTVRQADTLTGLQYQQVLNNLAMLQADPSALPSMITLKNGTAQVADTGSAGLGLDLGSRTHTAPSLMGTRSVVEQWGTSPVADDTTLRLLRLAYNRAIGDPRLLTASEADDLAHTLSAQIGTNADISTDSDTLRTLLAISREGAAPPAADPADPAAKPAGFAPAQARPAGEAGEGDPSPRPSRLYLPAALAAGSGRVPATSLAPRRFPHPGRSLCPKG